MPAAADLTLRQLRALSAVAEMGSFRRAADRLGITQPSLSAQVQGLEDALGRRLVERGRSGALLTPAGREVEGRGRAILDAVGALIDSQSGEIAGTLRLGVTPTLGPYLLPRVVAELHGSEPDLRLYIREASTRVLVRQLAEGLHDVVVTQSPLARPDLDSETLFSERLYLTLARDHALAAAGTIRSEDLAGLNVLSLDAGYQLHDQVRGLCESFGARFDEGYEGTSLDALRLMAGLGMGVTFLPALYALSEIRSDSEVVTREIAGHPVARPIALAWRRSAGRGAAIARLADVLRQTFASLAGQAPAR